VTLNPSGAIDHPGAVFEFARRAQLLALVWLERDPVQRLPLVWDALRVFPTCKLDAERAALALIVRHIAEGFVYAERDDEVPLQARLRRSSVQDIHMLNALNRIRVEFASSDLDLRSVASGCGVSPPYLSQLLSTITSYSYRAHLDAIRTLYAAYYLTNTSLSVKEIASRCGYTRTATLDWAFTKRFRLTPGEFRRWAT
jgi:AraC-like DNA-binding protein